MLSTLPRIHCFNLTAQFKKMLTHFTDEETEARRDCDHSMAGKHQKQAKPMCLHHHIQTEQGSQTLGSLNLKWKPLGKTNSTDFR